MEHSFCHITLCHGSTKQSFAVAFVKYANAASNTPEYLAIANVTVICANVFVSGYATCSSTANA
jgi:hypothetical protein